MQLYISNQLEQLAQKLAESVNSIQKENWAASMTILTPNFNLDKWISLTLAQQNQIAVNLQFMPIERFLQQQIDEPQVPIWNFEKLQLALMLEMEKILSLRTVSQELKPLQKYLSVPDLAEFQGAKANRLAKLAWHLAKIFQDYSIFRDIDILEKWEQGKSFLEQCSHSVNPFSQETESWQRELWQALSKYGISLPRHLKQIQYHQPEGDVFVFGFSYLPPFQYQALQQIAQTGCRLEFYALSPCQEFWEDLPTGKRKFLADPKETSLPNSFLQYWGRPAQEHLKSLLEQTNDEFKDCFQNESTHKTFLSYIQEQILNLQEEPYQESIEHDDSLNNESTHKTFLSYIQEQILNLQEEPYQESIEHDDSLNFWGASSIQHEARAVVGEICHRLAKDDTLRLDQIAIMTPNLADYQRTLEEAFAKIGQGTLTYNLIDAISDQACQLVRGVLILLDLGTQQLTRQTVWRFITHANFIARFQISEITLKQWENWMIKAGIFYDSADEPLSPFSWEHAFKRLELGTCFEEFSTDQDFVIAGKNYPPLAVMDSHVSDLLQMISILRSLFEQLAILQHSKNITNWGELFAKWVEQFLAPRDQHEENIFDLVVQKLRSLGDLEEIGTERTFDGLYAIQIAQFRIKSITTEKGYYSAGGVSISSFQPMRPIPFRIIFMMGLNEESYPRPQEINQLDLARFLPLQSCNFTTREKDAYAFLETIICARDAIYASYVNQNKKGEEALPSTFLQSMVRILNERYLSDDKNIAITQLPDYTSQEIPEFAKYNQEWIELANICQARETLQDQLKKQKTNIEQIPFDELQQWGFSKNLIPSHSVNETSQNTTQNMKPPSSSVTASTLKSFLENPAWATFQFHTRKTSNDAIYYEIPNWNVEADLKYQALSDIWHLAIQSADADWDKHIETYQKYLNDRSLWNDSLLGKLSFQYMKDTLEHWKSVIEGKAGKKPTTPIYEEWKDFANDVCFYQFGEPPSKMNSHGTKCKILSPLMIEKVQVDDEEIDVEIKGTIGWISQNAIFAFQAQQTSLFKLMTECLLQAILLAACDIKSCPDLKNAYVIEKNKSPRKTAFQMPSSHGAKQFLRSMLEDLLNQKNIEYFPLSEVEKWKAKTLQDWWETFLKIDSSQFNETISENIEKLSFANPNTDLFSSLEKSTVHEFYHLPKNAHQSLKARLSFLCNLL